MILWEVDSKEPIEEVSTNSEEIFALKNFSSRVVSVSCDRGIRIWAIAQMPKALAPPAGSKLKVRTTGPLGLPEASSNLAGQVQQAAAEASSPAVALDEARPASTSATSWGDSAVQRPLTKMRSNTVIGRRSSDSGPVEKEEVQPATGAAGLPELAKDNSSEEISFSWSQRPPRKSSHVIGRRNSDAAQFLVTKKKEDSS